MRGLVTFYLFESEGTKEETLVFSLVKCLLTGSHDLSALVGGKTWALDIYKVFGAFLGSSESERASST